MRKSEKYKIETLRDIRDKFRMPRFDALVNFLNAMAKSSKNSKINYLFQFINFILIVLLVFLILPECFDQWLSPVSEFEWTFLPIGRIVATIISYILGKTFQWFFAFSLSDLFETSFKITLWITAGLLLVTLYIFNKLLLDFKARVKQDLIILWQINK